VQASMGDSLGCISREDEEEGKVVASARNVSLSELDVFKEDDDGNSRYDCLGSVMGHQKRPSSMPLVPSLSLPNTDFPAPPSSSARQWTRRSSSSNSSSPNRDAAKAKQAVKLTQLRMRTGNSRFVDPQGRDEGDTTEGQGNHGPCAFVILCSPLPLPVEILFGLSTGELSVASASRAKKKENLALDDGGAAALELCLSAHEVQYLLVLGVLLEKKKEKQATDDVWAMAQQLLRVSGALRTAVGRGMAFLEGALLDLKTGEVDFLGKHEKQEQIIKQMLSHKNDPSNGATLQPDVPAREALVLLQCGNRRAVIYQETAASMPVGSARSLRSTGTGGRSLVPPTGSSRSLKSASGSTMTTRRRPPNHGLPGQRPVAVVFMDFDPHSGEGPLAEHLFDVTSSMLASVQTSGEDQSQEA